MIFKPYLVEKILAGEKVETRRPVQEGKPSRYRAGRTYAVQPGRTKPGVGRILIMEVRREKLGEIHHAGALREGFASVGDFLAYWRRLHGSVDLEQEVWVIRFGLEKGGR